MRKIYFLIVLPVFISSCLKDMEEQLIGTWKLSYVWKRSHITEKEIITTGYENSILSFLNGDNAMLVTGTDTLKGNWHSSWVTTTTGETSSSAKTLKVNLIDFQSNRMLNWEFEDFDLRNKKQRIRAVDRRLGKDWYYEFERQ